jgi:hypothetical protein
MAFQKHLFWFLTNSIIPVSRKAGSLKGRIHIEYPLEGIIGVFYDIKFLSQKHPSPVPA